MYLRFPEMLLSKPHNGQEIRSFTCGEMINYFNFLNDYWIIPKKTDRNLKLLNLESLSNVKHDITEIRHRITEISKKAPIELTQEKE